MNGTAVYIVAATIIVVVVVALLSYWTIRQVRRHETKRAPGVMTRRQNGDQHGDRSVGVPEDGPEEAPGDGPGDGPEEAPGDGPGDGPEEAPEEAPANHEAQGPDGVGGDSGGASEVHPGPEWRPEHRPPLVLARSEAEDGIRHLDEDQVVGLSAYEAEGTPWDAPVPLAEIRSENHDATDESEGSATAAQTAAAPGALAADDFHALLRRRLQHPAVLGWLVVSAEGEFRDGDQVYDDRVLELLTTLAANARETATTVGLTAPREVVVRGAEGVICVVPAGQIEAGRTESVVVFVEDGGPSPGEVARRLGAEDGAGLDDATTG